MSPTEKNYLRVKTSSNQSKIPVLHIIKSLGRGGAEILLPETLRKHDKEKYEFHYIYFLPWKNQVVGEIEKEGGKVTCIPAKNNLEIFLRARKIAAYVKEHKIQLIHCHLPWAGIVGRLVGRLTKVPVVYTEHNKWERYHKLTYFLNKFSFASQETVIAVSGEVAQSIKSHYKGTKPNVTVVMNGIDTDKYSPQQAGALNVREQLKIPVDAPVIGIACVFRAQKRLTTWVSIAAEIRAQIPNAHFIVVGDGILREEVFKKAKELNTENYLHFVGLQTETRPYFKAMDIFMMSSEFEGLPIAMLEAMSMGCMPACTAAGGIGEVVKDGLNGILVPVHDPMKLSTEIIELLNNSEELNKRKKAAQKTVIDSFSMTKMVGELEDIYSNVL